MNKTIPTVIGTALIVAILATTTTISSIRRCQGDAAGYATWRGAFISGVSYSPFCSYSVSDVYRGAFKIGYPAGWGAALH